MARVQRCSTHSAAPFTNRTLPPPPSVLEVRESSEARRPERRGVTPTAADDGTPAPLAGAQITLIDWRRGRGMMCVVTYSLPLKLHGLTAAHQHIYLAPLSTSTSTSIPCGRGQTLAWPACATWQHGAGRRPWARSQGQRCAQRGCRAAPPRWPPPASQPAPATRPRWAGPLSGGAPP